MYTFISYRAICEFFNKLIIELIQKNLVPSPEITTQTNVLMFFKKETFTISSNITVVKTEHYDMFPLACRKQFEIKKILCSFLHRKFNDFPCGILCGKL